MKLWFLSFFFYHLSASADVACVQNQFQPIEENFSTLLGRIGCTEVPVGESLPVVYRGSEIRPLGANYLLSRVSPNEYRIDLNLKFTGENQNQESGMAERISNCLRSLSGKLISEDGQSLSIGLLNSQDAQKIAQTQITIQPPDFRSNAFNYESDIDCPVITHEVFHLLGLVDEYVERDITSGDMACRSLGPLDSMMSNHQFAQMPAFEAKVRINYGYCTCPSQTACTNISSAVECVAGGFQVMNDSHDNRPGSFEIEEESAREFIESYFSGQRFYPGGMPIPFRKILNSTTSIPAQRPVGSILYPAHFRAITSPFCEQSNQKYLTCAKNAYLSKNKEIAGMILTGGECSQLPDYCYNGEWLR